VPPRRTRAPHAAVPPFGPRVAVPIQFAVDCTVGERLLRRLITHTPAMPERGGVEPFATLGTRPRFKPFQHVAAFWAHHEPRAPRSPDRDALYKIGCCDGQQGGQCHPPANPRENVHV
jgi:hypothetical protein